MEIWTRKTNLKLLKFAQYIFVWAINDTKEFIIQFRARVSTESLYTFIYSIQMFKFVLGCEEAVPDVLF